MTILMRFSRIWCSVAVVQCLRQLCTCTLCSWKILHKSFLRLSSKFIRWFCKRQVYNLWHHWHGRRWSFCYHLICPNRRMHNGPKKISKDDKFSFYRAQSLPEWTRTKSNMATFRQLRSTPLRNGVQHKNDGAHTICGLAPTECLSIYESILNLEPPYELYTQALPNVFCIELTTASTNDKAAHCQTEPSVFSLVKSH